MSIHTETLLPPTLRATGKATFSTHGGIREHILEIEELIYDPFNRAAAMVLSLTLEDDDGTGREQYGDELKKPIEADVHVEDGVQIVDFTVEGDAEEIAVKMLEDEISVNNRIITNKRIARREAARARLGSVLVFLGATAATPFAHWLDPSVDDNLGGFTAVSVIVGTGGALFALKNALDIPVINESILKARKKVAFYSESAAAIRVGDYEPNPTEA